MKKYLPAKTIAALALLAGSQLAFANTVVTLGDQDFADGATPTTGAFLTAGSGEPVPFDGVFSGSDVTGPNFSASWTFSYSAIVDTITGGSLKFGIYDHESAASGNQVASFTVNGVDFTGALNTDGIANCYHEQASFEDIAFRLKGKKQIHAMWDMICSDNEKGKSNIKVEIKELSVNDSSAHAIVVEDYTYRDEGRDVHNRIVSRFEFRDGLIYKQIDKCNPVCWASQAFGGIKGFIAGHIEFVRRFKAMRKLKASTSRSIPFLMKP